MDINAYSNRGRVYPYRTPQQLHGEVGRTAEWWGTDVGGDRTTSEPGTGGQGHRWRLQPHQHSDVGTDLVASATGGNITNHNADATRNRHPPRYAPASAAATTTTTPTPHNTDTSNGGTHTHTTTAKGKPKTAQGSPAMMPVGLRARGDGPTDT